MRVQDVDLAGARTWILGSASDVLLGVAVLLLAARAYILLLHRRLSRRDHALERERSRIRQLQAELAGLRRELEQRVRERTQALEARAAELTHLKLALEAANRRLQRLVVVDALTGIANRCHFDRTLERELRRTRREGLPLSLIFLDLDEFKRFNDTYGHAQGDRVLRLIAQALDETFRRGGDLIARYGGEEFAVILPGVDGRRAELYAERLRRRIWRLAIPYEASRVADRVTISGGVATMLPGFSGMPDDLLRAADQALYRAKCQGRNRICTEKLLLAEEAGRLAS